MALTGAGSGERPTVPTTPQLTDLDAVRFFLASWHATTEVRLAQIEKEVTAMTGAMNSINATTAIIQGDLGETRRRVEALGDLTEAVHEIRADMRAIRASGTIEAPDIGDTTAVRRQRRNGGVKRDIMIGGGSAALVQLLHLLADLVMGQ
jgi:hypothetical protein